MAITQIGLIDIILTVINLDIPNAKDTPTAEGNPPKHADGEPFNEPFIYTSVLGMILYLQYSSHLDISFAVNQCTRCSFSPNKSYEEALKSIGR